MLPKTRKSWAQILGKRSWFGIPAADVAGRLKGDINYGNGRTETANGLEMKFWKDHASTRSKAMMPGSSPRTSAGATCPERPTSRRLSTRSIVRTSGAMQPQLLGLLVADIPESTSRGPETFFDDGKIFDPADPTAYLDSLAIRQWFDRSGAGSPAPFPAPPREDLRS